MRRTAVVVAIVGVALACTRDVRKDPSVCPEYRDMRCMTSTVCSMDQRRGCKVCACDDPDQLPGRAPDSPGSVE